MKLNKYSLALILGLSTLVSCSDRMDLLNPNQQTSSTFGFNADDLEECVIAAYNHIRMEGSYARVGYTIVGAVGAIEPVQRRVGGVICDKGRILIITY